MRVEFNRNGFTADINENGNSRAADGYAWAERGIKKQMSLILAVMALIIAALLLPFGLFINIGTDMLANLLGENLAHWTTVLLAISFVFIAISVFCGILAIIGTRKTKQEETGVAVLMLAILSFVLCAVCLVFNILGFVIW